MKIQARHAVETGWDFPDTSVEATDSIRMEVQEMVSSRKSSSKKSSTSKTSKKKTKGDKKKKRKRESTGGADGRSHKKLKKA